MKRHFGARSAESFTRSKYWIAANLKREGTVLGLERTLTSIANDRYLSRSHEAAMSTTEGPGRPRLNHSADAKKLRRYFIGGSGCLPRI
jgi:hypothetical protein